MDITLLMNTARDDFPMVGLPDTFIFEPTIRSLNKQELKNFELVIVDALWSEKRKRWLEEHARFPVKYIDALPNRWLEHGMVGIATQKNKGLLYAEGELVVFVDDCVMFPLRDWTRKIWGWYEKGYWPMSLTCYFEGGRPKLMKDGERRDTFHKSPTDEPDLGELYSIFRPGDVVRDSRFKFVGDVLEAPSSWFYGGSSAALDALLRINGIDERFDGKKGLEDVDTGMRLENAGYSGKFILDRSLYHIENWHRGASSRVLT
ncbi:MAG: glycosyltransferase family 2 protein, partial [Deltaproteobacteria bacterium]|nr:glycosyltransferase family 2 protein [Deltaproteobacteria bacterium]